MRFFILLFRREQFLSYLSSTIAHTSATECSLRISRNHSILFLFLCLYPALRPFLARLNEHDVSLCVVGSLLWDEEGNEWLDFACGIGVTNTGHCHPKVLCLF